MGKVARIGFVAALVLGMAIFAGNAGAELTNISIDTGTPGTAKTCTITPDWDGTDDMAYINVKSSVEGDLRITVDTNGDGNFDTITNWDAIDWSDPTAVTMDFTIDRYYIPADNTERIWFEGRSAAWDILGNGTYKIKIEIEQDRLLDYEIPGGGGRMEYDYDDGVAADETLTVKVETGCVTGTCIDESSKVIAGVEIHAGGDAGHSRGYTDSNGVYTIGGFGTGTINVDVRKVGYVSAQHNDILVTAGQTTDADDDSKLNFTMKAATTVRGTVSIKDADGNPVTFTSYINRWGWTENRLWINIDAWSPRGEGHGWANAEILSADVDPDASHTSTTYTLSLSPGTFNIQARAEGYASEMQVITIAADGTITGSTDITMTKATVITATITLDPPATQRGWMNLSFRPVDETTGNWGWGGGDIGRQADDSFINPTVTPVTTTYLRADSVLAGTYMVELHVDGYVPQTLYTRSNPLTVGTSDINLNSANYLDGAITVGQGGVIKGTLTVQGGVDRNTNLYINAWSPDTHWGSGTDVIYTVTADSVNYEISGLDKGASYYVDTWLNGYETYPKPMSQTVTPTEAGADYPITLRAFSGSITGKITSESADFDITKVRIEAVVPGWGWSQGAAAKTAYVGRVPPNLDAGTGVFTISGLGTGFYLITANQYISAGDSGIDDEANGGKGFATIDIKANVANGEKTDVGTLTLVSGAVISGTVIISKTDPPPDGFNTIADYVALQDAGIIAFPMKMQMMGMMSNCQMGDIELHENGTDGTYDIYGLAPGAYTVEPALMFNVDEYGEAKKDGPDMERVAAYSTRMVVVKKAETKTDVDFTFSDGYDISGKVTLPAAPTQDWDWICKLEAINLSDATWSGSKEFMGYTFTEDGKTPNERKVNPWDPPLGHNAVDFLKSTTYTLRHLIPGEYLIMAHSEKYMMGSATATISDGDLSGINLTLKKGANIIGKLVNKESGSAVTAVDQVAVRCEARPFIEGSWRETRNRTHHEWDDTAGKEIEVLETGGSFIAPSDSTDSDWPPGKFILRNLPAGNYVVTVGPPMDPESSGGWGERTDGSKNYSKVTIAGINISEGNVSNNADIDIGTIKLSEGITISGRVYYDEDGVEGYLAGTDEPLANIPVEAEPLTTRSMGFDSNPKANTRSDGTYTIHGVDPNIRYWEVIAAPRFGWMQEQRIPYGEAWQEFAITDNDGNAVNRKDINFSLEKADATVTGTITRPADGPEFALPPFEEGGMMGMKSRSMPQCLVILQKKGEMFDDPMEGIKQPSDPSQDVTTDFTTQDVVPGDYILKVFSTGYVTATKEITIKSPSAEDYAEGDNDVGTITLESGGTISGTVRMDDGTNPSTNVIQQVVVMKTDFSNMSFGKLTSNSTTRKVSAYEATGVKQGDTYKLVFCGGEGSKLWIMPDTFNLSAATDVYSYNAIITDYPPELFAFAEKSGDDIEIMLWATEELSDADAGECLTVTDSAGTGLDATEQAKLSNARFIDDKLEIDVTYTPAAGAESAFYITAVVHDVGGNEVTRTFTFYPGVDMLNIAQVGAYTGGSVMLGGGDQTQVYIPAGAIDGADDNSGDGGMDGMSEIEITETSLAGASAMGVLPMSAAAYPGCVKADVPGGASSSIYDISALHSDTVTGDATLTIGLEYDAALIGNEDNLNVYYYDTTTGYWRKENTNRTIKNTNNQHRIQVDVNHLTKFCAVASDGPGVVQGLTATAGDGQVALAWTAEASSTCYNVYKSTTSGSGYALVNSNVAGTSYTVTSLTNGTTYYFVVRGVDTAIPTEGSDCDEASATPEAAAPTPTTGGGGGGPCFIATAAYGTPMAKEVKVLCKFRDEYLLKAEAGETFVKLYYRTSPPIADFIRDKTPLKAFVRIGLRPVVEAAKVIVK